MEGSVPWITLYHEGPIMLSWSQMRFRLTCFITHCLFQNALAVYPLCHSVVLNQRPHASYPVNNNSFTYNAIASPKTEPSEDLTSGEESSFFTTLLPLDLLDDLIATNNNSLLSAVTSSSKEYSQIVSERIGIDNESISTTPVCQVKQYVPTQVTLFSPRAEHQKLLRNTGSNIQSD